MSNSNIKWNSNIDWEALMSIIMEELWLQIVNTAHHASASISPPYRTRTLRRSQSLSSFPLQNESSKKFNVCHFQDAVRLTWWGSFLSSGFLISNTLAGHVLMNFWCRDLYLLRTQPSNTIKNRWTVLIIYRCEKGFKSRPDQCVATRASILPYRGAAL